MDEKNEAKVCFETIKSTLDGMKWNYEIGRASCRERV